ncbi:MAG: sugar MFS transporter [Caulobacteraceae bacterium]
MGARDPAGGVRERPLLGLMMGLFFAFGFCTVLVDTLIPKLKGLFHLSYAEVMLTQSCFFLAFFLVSGPAGWLVGAIGYMRTVVVGLVVMSAGCVLFTPAADAGSYPAFLGALFILASGVTTVQVAANPLAANLGDPAKASARLTLAQAFNSVATMLAPQFGAFFILGHAAPMPDPGRLAPAALAALRVHEAQTVQGPFLIIAASLAVFALLCWLARRWAGPLAARPGAGFAHLFGRPRVVLGAIAIFTYVGAEVAIGSSIANFLMSPKVLGLAMRQAGQLISVYWGLAMVGRFAGAWLLRGLPAGAVLTGCALGSAALAATAALAGGPLAAIAILAVGLFNSIQFPTIFTLAIEGLGEATPAASGLLCLAIVGGAAAPLATGFAADRLGLSLALFVPVACYLWVATYCRLVSGGALVVGAAGR